MTDSVLNLPDDTRMLDVVRRRLERADDVRIAVSFTRCSGLGLLVDPLREVAGRGGRVRVPTSTWQSVTQPEAVESLRPLTRVETRVQNGPVGFHSKFWWFRGTSEAACWAGSSTCRRAGSTACGRGTTSTTRPTRRVSAVARVGCESRWPGDPLCEVSARARVRCYPPGGGAR